MTCDSKLLRKSGRFSGPLREHRSARGVEVAALYLGKHLESPSRLRDGVVIDKENELAGSLVDGAISREAGAGLGFQHVPDREGCGGGDAPDGRLGIVGRVVVDDDAFEAAIGRRFERDDARQRLGEQAGAIMGRDGDGDFCTQGTNFYECGFPASGAAGLESCCGLATATPWDAAAEAGDAAGDGDNVPGLASPAARIIGSGAEDWVKAIEPMVT